MTDQPSPEEFLVLRRRAERLRAEVRDEADDDSALPIARFQVGEDRFAIHLSQLRAVVPLRLITPVPLAAPHVIGVLKFDGKIVTAYSLAARLGVRGWKQDPEVLLVIELPDGNLAALDCEQVPTADTLPAKRVAEARLESDPWFEVRAADGSMINVIDVPRLLTGSK
jgi:purine-binding chemotaxis protein CheW